jgi:hypothetical protein
LMQILPPGRVRKINVGPAEGRGNVYSAIRI